MQRGPYVWEHHLSSSAVNTLCSLGGFVPEANTPQGGHKDLALHRATQAAELSERAASIRDALGRNGHYGGRKAEV